MLYDWRARALQYLIQFAYSVALVLFSWVAFGLRSAARFLRDMRAESWAQTNGIVTTRNVRAMHGWFVDYALGQLGYSYQVDGEYYSGYLTRQCNDEQTAWTYVDTWWNRPVVVRYKTSHPETSALREADQFFAS